MTDNKNGNYLIYVPDIGEGIAEVEIVEWPVNIGDMIKEDDVICVVMTDKATVEIPSPVDGKMCWIGAEPGEMMSVGAELIALEVEGEGNWDGTFKTEPTSPEIIDSKAVIDSSPEDISSDSDETQQPEVTASQTKTAEVTSKPQISNTTDVYPGIPRPEGDKPIAAPAVRKRARNAGINLHYVQGTGPANRISHEDLDRFISLQSQGVASVQSSNSANTKIDKIKVIGLRRKIASVMQDTMQRIPHFTYVEEIDVTELEALRAKLNAQRNDEQPKLTVLPFIMKAMVKAIKAYPEMSSRYDDQENIVHQFGAAHIGIATQTDNGLVVPVVKHVEALDLWQSAAEIKRLSSAARNGNAHRDELSGSTITITSLGPIGGIVTTPVINSPEVAIVGINKIAKRPVWQNGTFVARDMMNISSSFDHRIIDGWEATQFIQQIKQYLETPAMLFMEA